MNIFIKDKIIFLCMMQRISLLSIYVYYLLRVFTVTLLLRVG